MPNDNVEVDSEVRGSRQSKNASVYEMKTEYPKKDRDFIHQYVKDEEGCKCKKVKFKWLY